MPADGDKSARMLLSQRGRGLVEFGLRGILQRSRAGIEGHVAGERKRESHGLGIVRGRARRGTGGQGAGLQPFLAEVLDGIGKLLLQAPDLRSVAGQIAQELFVGRPQNLRTAFGLQEFAVEFDELAGQFIVAIAEDPHLFRIGTPGQCQHRREHCD